MTPAARVAAAIAVLDGIVEGQSAEKALSGWARGARYAGSGDRAAVRDHVFDVLRCWRSCACRGGGETGRALMLGLLRGQGIDPDTLFTGAVHAPDTLAPQERAAGQTPDAAAARDLPTWLWPRFQAALGDMAEAAAQALRHRGPITLRVHLRRITRDAAMARLHAEGIDTEPVALIDSALRVTGGARRIAQCALYREGVIELQDASCQAAMAQLEPGAGARVLDYCAGAGGKTLALAARLDCRWFAHDVADQRLARLPERAARAGAQVQLLDARGVAGAAPYDLVLCDVPCSGSGTWRRNPEAKWALSPERLGHLAGLQRDILIEAAAHVAPAGCLVYATCSVLREENQCVVARFLSDCPGWTCDASRIWPLSDEGDGFFLATFKRC